MKTKKIVSGLLIASTMAMAVPCNAYAASEASSELVAMIVVSAFSAIASRAYRYGKRVLVRREAKVQNIKDPAVVIDKLDKQLSIVKGQEKAKQQVRKIMLNIVDKKGQYASHPSPKAGPGANILYMVGPSGVGKSYMADIITKILNGSKAVPCVIEASDIDKASKDSAVDQLFGIRRIKTKNGRITDYSPFITRVLATPNTVVIINEYDKMYTPDLDEKLRTIVDQGYIKVSDKKIDCSAVTFIITSNESSGSVNKGNDEEDKQNDSTGSRTFIDHDKSFLNRVKIIEFENLSAADYKEIAQKPFSQLVERYKTQYETDVDLNGVVDEVAQKVHELNRGARPIFDYLDSLNNELLNEIFLNKDNKSDHYKVSFDKEKDDFILESINLPEVINEKNIGIDSENLALA